MRPSGYVHLLWIVNPATFGSPPSLVATILVEKLSKMVGCLDSI